LALLLDTETDIMDSLAEAASAARRAALGHVVVTAVAPTSAC
jgi:hypothetical protein